MWTLPQAPAVDLMGPGYYDPSCAAVSSLFTCHGIAPLPTLGGRSQAVDSFFLPGIYFLFVLLSCSKLEQFSRLGGTQTIISWE